MDENKVLAGVGCYVVVYALASVAGTVTVIWAIVRMVEHFAR